jgi:DNA polymerase III subunit alpha
MLFANQLQQFGGVLEDEAVVLVKGTVRPRGSDIEVSAEEVTPLSELTRRDPRALLVLMEADTPTRRLLEIKDLLLEHPGELPVTIQVRLPDSRVEVTPLASFKVRPDEGLLASLRRLVGEEHFRLLYAAA